MTTRTSYETQWFPCQLCGQPVIARDGFLVDAAIGGRLGDEQIDTDVEHECNDR